ncbi:prokaryotic E2 ligase family D protein [Photobacterium sp. ZSDE20]|uniref:Prokaryotic E2 ligase family D protein n=1 Tax=Photobacterium pectinilyticum TaxID=2906793 RepID=A0ABT1N0W5_9GAMM|nr:prokaryotic E2 ligase family D protein [Photobacterium sp. ZSDE20]MCQ1058380.1 prokaryotic E2 ligase family D protein [Photobacterium sp. ZSDE20]MDD1825257.1 prokaryotic E2 ligase family D protein [Photobacterium sp. ZSDE20]
MEFVAPTKPSPEYLNPISDKIEFHFALVLTSAGITRHQIENGLLLDGVWLDDTSCINAIDDIKAVSQRNVEKEVEFIPRNVLVDNDDFTVWYVEPRTCPMWFTNPPEYSALTAVTYPRLVFKTSKRRRTLSVVAVERDVELNANTAIYHAPCANMYEATNLCIGNAKMPEKVNFKSLSVCEDALFNSRYSGFKFFSFNPKFDKELAPEYMHHDLFGEEKFTYRKLVAAWAYLSATKQPFPDSWLKPIGNIETLGNWINKGV